MYTVLIVDDVAAMAEQYAYDLRRLASVDARVASSGDEALQLVATENVDCMILDLEMPGKDGFAVLRALKERGADFPVIVYTGTGSFDRCVQAMRLGAYTFIDKADPVERVAREVETAIERRVLIAEVTSLRRYAAEDTALRGSSAPMQKLKDAYVKARYSRHYSISDEELSWLENRVEELGRVIQAVCLERIAALERSAAA